eukprot:9467147-Pyramimonas_sp.AAC.1
MLRARPAWSGDTGRLRGHVRRTDVLRGMRVDLVYSQGPGARRERLPAACLPAGMYPLPSRHWSDSRVYAPSPHAIGQTGALTGGMPPRPRLYISVQQGRGAGGGRGDGAVYDRA